MCNSKQGIPGSILTVIESVPSGQAELHSTVKHHCATGNRKVSQTPEGKKPLRRPRRRWEDNTKMDVR